MWHGHDKVRKFFWNTGRLDVWTRAILLDILLRWMPPDIDHFMISVKMAFDPDNLLTARKRTASTNQMQRRFRARGAKAYSVGTGNCLTYNPRQLLMIGSLKDRCITHAHRRLQCFVNRWMAMPQ